MICFFSSFFIASNIARCSLSCSLLNCHTKAVPGVFLSHLVRLNPFYKSILSNCIFVTVDNVIYEMMMIY